MNGEPILDLIVEAAWKSAVVAGVVLLLLAALRKRSAAERACVAHVGMAALLLLPLLVVAGPRLEWLPAEEQVATMAAASPTATIEEEPVSTAPATPMASAPLDTQTLLTWAYGVPAAIMLLLTVVAILRLFALRGRATVIVQQGWLSALAHAQRRMGIKSGTALLVSEELTSPVSWGVMRPVILLNEEALETAADAEAIIAHELAHVARLDWLNLLAARIATALFWFNPLVWLLARLGHQLREEAADDAVLRADVPHADYAALLVGAARHESKGLLLAAHGVAPGKGSLAMRVHRILEPALSRSPARLAWAGGSAAVMVAVAAPLAALSPMQPPAPPVVLAAVPAPPAPPAAISLPAPAAAVPTAISTGTSNDGATTTALVAGPAAIQVAAPPPPAGVATAAAVATGVAVAQAQTNGRVARNMVISPDGLVAMRAHGISGERAEAYAAAYPRLRGLDVDELVAFHIHGVSPSRLREYAALGYSNLSTDQITEWAVHGVTPGYIRSIAEAGYRHLSPARLTEFRIYGVSAASIRRLREAGLGNVSPERLVEMQVLGTGPRRTPRVPVPARPGRSPPPPPSTD